jgi:uncharacterized protein (DUF1499 family)
VRLLAGLAAVSALGAALLAWPLLNDVETGRTPQYPDLRPRSYRAGPAEVARAARAALEALPRFRVTGSGSGPRGHEIQAVATTRVFRFEDDVTVRIAREGGRTRLSIRSRSRVGKWDFGQNARNVREVLAALDERLRPDS